MTSLLIHVGQSITQKEADTTDVNWMPPEVNCSGVVSVTSSQQARFRFPDIEHTSLSVVSMGPPPPQPGGGPARPSGWREECGEVDGAGMMA